MFRVLSHDIIIENTKFWNSTAFWTSQFTFNVGKGKGKGKVHPRTAHEGPEGEKRYSSTFPLTSALDGGWVVNATSRPPYLWEKDPIPVI